MAWQVKLTQQWNFPFHFSILFLILFSMLFFCHCVFIYYKCSLYLKSWATTSVKVYVCPSVCSHFARWEEKKTALFCPCVNLSEGSLGSKWENKSSLAWPWLSQFYVSILNFLKNWIATSCSWDRNQRDPGRNQADHLVELDSLLSVFDFANISVLTALIQTGIP